MTSSASTPLLVSQNSSTPNMLAPGIFHNSVLHPLPWKPPSFPLPVTKLPQTGAGPLLGQLPASSPALPPHRPGIPREDLGKSLPIHVVVETVGSSRHRMGGPANLDTFAIIPASCPFSELVPQTLLKLGYSPSQTLAAKGRIELKNWKPLSLDLINDQADVTVDQILGDLTSVATLKIRVSNWSSTGNIEDIKGKLLDLLLQHSQGVLTALGCPLDKGLLYKLCRDDYTQSVSSEACQAFQNWYREKVNVSRPEHSETSKQKGDPTQRSSPKIQHNDGPPAMSPSSKLRMRTCFDADHELPRLHAWFATNSHPSREQMQVYLEELNKLDARQDKKPLDISNIIYWFKNARAALRRDVNSTSSPKAENAPSNDESLSRESSSQEDEADLSVDYQADEGKPDREASDDSQTSEKKPTDNFPELPNKNAVYVVQPLRQRQEEDFEVVHFSEEMAGRNTSPRQMDEIKKEIEHQKDEGDENHNKCGSGMQEEATDLSVKPRRGSTDSGLHSSHGSSAFHHSLSNNSGIKREYDDDDDDDDYDQYLSSPNSDSPSPRLPSKDLNQLPTAVNQPSLHPHPYGPHALQMAAMSHAFHNMHYMNPVSLYGLESPPAPINNSYMNEESSLTNGETDRKKRSRVFIDPLSEIPKLEKWFVEDTHPSSYMIEKYTEELNRQAYRQRFPKLEAKNVQLWFKNHRAKVKRQRLDVNCGLP